MKRNRCIMEVRFTCSTHTQPNCPYFEQSGRCPTTLCLYGTPDCNCYGTAAQAAAIADWLRKGEKDE